MTLKCHDCLLVDVTSAQDAVTLASGDAVCVRHLQDRHRLEMRLRVTDLTERASAHTRDLEASLGVG